MPDGPSERDGPRRGRRLGARVRLSSAWLSKDYEYLRACSENAIYLSIALLFVRRLAGPAR
ncbi:hypothetical protein OHB14_58435 [Streptomyces sp. NBC_01613]|uniref:hypothetical protein n=1 Tax=Streptomyces sp. NBC_01613 TaxID=2975896 RepID=UPI003863C591